MNGYPKNLAELLGDYIGAIKGEAPVSSDRVNVQFTDYLVKKRSEGRL